jgi:hypothetical protein
MYCCSGASAPLRRHVGDGPLEHLQERLLHALARDVARDRDVLARLADLIDLVDVDDPLLGRRDVVVGGRDELEDQVLDVLADVAGLGQGGGVADGEGHVQAPRQGLGQRRLAAAGRADQQDVALGDLHVLQRRVVDLLGHDPLVVVDDGHGQDPLHAILPDDVVVQVGDQLPGASAGDPGAGRSAARTSGRCRRTS